MALETHVTLLRKRTTQNSCGSVISVNPTILKFAQVEYFATCYISPLIKTFYISRSHKTDQIEKDPKDTMSNKKLTAQSEHK